MFGDLLGQKKPFASTSNVSEVPAALAPAKTNMGVIKEIRKYRTHNAIKQLHILLIDFIISLDLV